MLDCGLRINTLTMLNCKENGTLILAKNNYKQKTHIWHESNILHEPKQHFYLRHTIAIIF